MKLGELIAIARECKGWTLRDLERESGVSNALISQIERGKVKDPGLSTIVRLADSLGLSIERVAATARPPIAAPSDDDGRIRSFNGVEGTPQGRLSGVIFWMFFGPIAVVLVMAGMSETPDRIAQKMADTLAVCGDRWFKMASDTIVSQAAELARLKAEVVETGKREMAAWAERDQYMRSNVKLIELIRDKRTLLLQAYGLAVSGQREITSIAYLIEASKLFSEHELGEAKRKAEREVV